MSTARGPVGGTVDLEADPGRAAELCTRAQARLLAAVEVLADADVRRASRLPGWSIGHVLTHLARNADAHARRLAGALDGQDVAKYPGGAAQRARDIEDGAGRSAAELVQDLAVSQQRLEQLFTACAAAGWPGRRLLGGAHYPATGCPAHRLREVEVHHVDLDIGYGPADWPAEFVAWELPGLLASVPDRLRSREDRAAVLAWLTGRGASPTGLRLDPW
ncbi:maleylpyruvate isomerase family mycothiol-dependent enzyme [Modestobacter sp. L9-4]|uniref:maleylpyruvate isomerase N-terminal domain-containing protein n=1 Tax=Modestobacter sp. L9-4 TaxID=2851567 RepID=UPI001C74F16E|nr:maleylpyruvate isomerase family mycothiol-dependent enzyme [Modestobacter sp. L9-4]QXG76611.1 maleylpyruvate isomerase family mycothiol-dependent enzyme [Modestobacter sp. L9-4]